MPLSLSLSVQITRSAPRRPREEARTGIFTHLYDFIRRLRVRKYIIVMDTPAELSEDSYSWLEPPPSYDGNHSTCTCSVPADAGGLDESDPAMFGEEVVLTDQAETDLFGSPASNVHSMFPSNICSSN